MTVRDTVEGGGGPRRALKVGLFLPVGETMFDGATPHWADIQAIARLAEDAEERGVTLMVENLGRFGRLEDLAPIFAAAPSARLHLDVGHANLARDRGEPNRAPQLLDAFGDRLAHVHVHDNSGYRDEHLPLGAGSVDWPDAVRRVRATGYDGTVTLEVFSREREHLRSSRRLWLEWWARS